MCPRGQGRPRGLHLWQLFFSASWSSGNAFVSGAGGLRFKSDAVLPTARHRCDISSKGAMLPGRNDAEMGPANSLHVSAYYSEYNERFNLKIWLYKRAKCPSTDVEMTIFFRKIAKTFQTFICEMYSNLLSGSRTLTF